jgi:hypothetical protein
MNATRRIGPPMWFHLLLVLGVTALAARARGAIG